MKYWSYILNNNKKNLIQEQALDLIKFYEKFYLTSSVSAAMLSHLLKKNDWT